MCLSIKPSSFFCTLSPNGSMWKIPACDSVETQHSARHSSTGVSENQPVAGSLPEQAWRGHLALSVSIEATRKPGVIPSPSAALILPIGSQNLARRETWLGKCGGGCWNVRMSRLTRGRIRTSPAVIEGILLKYRRCDILACTCKERQRFGARRIENAIPTPIFVEISPNLAKYETQQENTRSNWV